MLKGVQSDDRYETVRERHMYTCLRKSSEISLIYVLLLTVCKRLEIISFYCYKNLYADYAFQ